MKSARVVVEDAQPPVVCLGTAAVPSGMALILSDSASAKSLRALNSCGESPFTCQKHTKQFTRQTNTLLRTSKFPSNQQSITKYKSQIQIAQKKIQIVTEPTKPKTSNFSIRFLVIFKLYSAESYICQLHSYVRTKQQILFIYLVCRVYIITEVWRLVEVLSYQNT